MKPFSKNVVLFSLIVLVCVCVENCVCKINCKHVNIVIAKSVNEGESITFEGITYSPNEYFRNETTGEIHGCICEKKTCVHKCCPLGYSSRGKACVASDKKFDPPIWDEYIQLNRTASEIIHFYEAYEKLNCSLSGKFMFKISQFAESGWGLQADGSLYHAIPDAMPPYKLYSTDLFCIDHFVTKNQSALDARVCVTPDKEEEHLDYNIAAPCMYISCVFIIITVVLYFLLPELKSLHFNVLMTSHVCLGVALFSLATLQVITLNHTHTMNVCISFTFIIYFSFLSAFFWLSVLAFDVWRSVSGRHDLTITACSIKESYAAYALIGFGVPAALTILLAILQFADLPKHELLPSIGVYGCFVTGKRKNLYLYGPLLLALAINIIFFVMTAFVIEKNNTYVAATLTENATSNSRTTNDKNRFLVYLKLFFLMGFLWILEVLSANVPAMKKFWYITDVYNLLTGVTIFILFITQPRVLRLVKKRIAKCRGIAEPETETGASYNLVDNNLTTLDTIKDQH